MFESLRQLVEDLRDSLQTSLGIPVALTPAHNTEPGQLAAYIDAPRLEPARTRLSGDAGQRVDVVLVAPGPSDDQVLALYDALPVALAAVPDGWTFPQGAVIQPVTVNNAPAFQIPLAR